MTTGEAIAMAVSILGGLAGIVFGVVAILRNRKQDDTADGKESGVILTELGYIKAGVDDVKRKQERQDESMTGFLRDLTEVRESTKSAHKRIDSLEERIH